ncbi:hypothetical protein BsWGS_04282 [Bradybaena similaris]
MASSGCQDYTVRTMRPEEVEETYQLIDKEGWNLSVDKFSALHKCFPNNFFVAVTQDGEVAGTMSLFPTFEGEFVLGNIVVKDGHRYKGLGRKIVDDVFALFPNAVVSLTAVPGADQFYINTGFTLTQPQQGHDIFYLLLDRERLKAKSRETGQQGVTVSLYDGCGLDDLVAYDREARGYENRTYVAMQVQCFKVATARNSTDQLVGFGVAFIKREKIVLDGLYADSDAIATQIFTEIIEQFPDRNSMKLQVPSSRLFLSELGEIESSYKYNRYSKGQPTLSPLSKVYNVADCDYTY